MFEIESPGLNTSAAPDGVATSPGATLTAPTLPAPTAVRVSATALTPDAGIPARPAAVTVRTVPAGIGVEYPPVPLRVSSNRPVAGTNRPAGPVDGVGSRRTRPRRHPELQRAHQPGRQRQHEDRSHTTPTDASLRHPRSQDGLPTSRNGTEDQVEGPQS